jgi:thiamine-phosphate pyrophosphorylase
VLPARRHVPLIAAVTDRRRFGATESEARRQLVAWAAALAGAGIDIIQIRERGLTDAALLTLVREVIGATAGAACRVLVNDRVDVALAGGAAGVHLPAAGVPAARARRLAPAGFLIGQSVHSREEAMAAEQSGACDHLIFGTVFESASKPVGHRLAGLDGLSGAAAAVTLPVLAIGGVTVGRGAELARAGAAGAAAIGLFADPWLSSSPRTAAARLGEIVGSLRLALTRSATLPASGSDHADGS